MITEDHNFKYKIGSYTGEVIINTTILLYSIPFLFFFKGDTFNFDSYLPMFLLWGLNTMFTIVYIMLRRYYDKRPLVISLEELIYVICGFWLFGFGMVYWAGLAVMVVGVVPLILLRIASIFNLETDVFWILLFWILILAAFVGSLLAILKIFKESDYDPGVYRGVMNSKIIVFFSSWLS